MGVSSIIGKHVLSAELDCFDNNGVGFGTCDVDIRTVLRERNRAFWRV